MIKVINENNLPDWVKYPNLYKELINQNEDEFLPWYLTDIEDSTWRINGLKKRYSNRVLFPFARKDCSDDIACWQKGHGNKVFIIHDFASSGWEQREVFNSFDEWYQWALKQEY